jgi:hypothetical protein
MGSTQQKYVIKYEIMQDCREIPSLLLAAAVLLLTALAASTVVVVGGRRRVCSVIDRSSAAE